MCLFQMTQNTALRCAQLNSNSYQFVYSCHMPTEAAILGTFSLLLTIVNIICIFIAGIFVLKVCFLLNDYFLSFSGILDKFLNFGLHFQ